MWCLIATDWLPSGNGCWHNDGVDRQVLAVDLASGERELICEVPNQPSGLGWLPDGRMLVVSTLDRKVLRREPDGRLAEHADLSGIATFHANDGSVSAATPDLGFPNGMVLFGRTLIIAETLGLRLTAFDVADDGSLSSRRVWADLQDRGIAPDGICGDAEGAIWTSSALGRGVFRVTEGGGITDEITTAQTCYAVALTGPRRRTVAYMTAPDSNPSVVAGVELGAIEVAEVAVPGS